MPTRFNKLPICRGVVCLEVRSAHGGQWWYAPASLGYSPALAEELRDLRVAFIEGLGQRRLVGRVPGLAHWVAVNVARSDVERLMQLGRWQASFPAPPFDGIRYSEWPASSRGLRAQASAARLQSPQPRSS